MINFNPMLAVRMSISLTNLDISIKFNCENLLEKCGVTYGLGPKKPLKTENKSIFEVSFFVVYRPVFLDPGLDAGYMLKLHPKYIAFPLGSALYFLIKRKFLERNQNGEY